MSDLVRLDCDDQGVMHPHSDGDWCDYSEAQAEIERLQQIERSYIAVHAISRERLRAVVDALKEVHGWDTISPNLTTAVAALEVSGDSN